MISGAKNFGVVILFIALQAFLFNCTSHSRVLLEKKDSISWTIQPVQKQEFEAADSLHIPFDSNELPSKVKINIDTIQITPYNVGCNFFDFNSTCYLGFGFQNNREIFIFNEETPSWSFYYLFHMKNGAIDSIIGKPKFYTNRIISFQDWMTDCSHEIAIWKYEQNQLEQMINFNWRINGLHSNEDWLMDVALVNDSTFITKTLVHSDTLYVKYTGKIVDN